MPRTSSQTERALADGKRHGLVPPSIIGRVALGKVRIHDGQLDEGLQMLDDVAVELTTGNLDPLTTGQMWCELICAMQWVGQPGRAEEWTEAMEHWRKGAAFGGLNGRCRVHRAEILRMRGPCDAAEQEALLACEELRPWMRREFGWPLTRRIAAIALPVSAPHADRRSNHAGSSVHARIMGRTCRSDTASRSHVWQR